MTEGDQQEAMENSVLDKHLSFSEVCANSCMHKMVMQALQLVPRIKGLHQQISMSVLQRTGIICKTGNWDIELQSD